MVGHVVLTHAHSQSAIDSRKKLDLGAGASGGDRHEEEVEVWKRRQSLQASGAAAQTQESSDSAHGTIGKMEKYLWVFFLIFYKIHLCITK